MTGLCDHVVMVRGRGRAFLAGPPLLKAATGEIADDDALGGADMHASVSGLAEHVADDDASALAVARELIGARTPAKERMDFQARHDVRVASVSAGDPEP